MPYKHVKESIWGPNRLIFESKRLAVGKQKKSFYFDDSFSLPSLVALPPPIGVLLSFRVGFVRCNTKPWPV